MAIIELDRLEEGMTLKSDVCDRSGRLLLPAGSDLTGKLLNIFRMWGVTEADIVRNADEELADAPREGEPVDPQLLAEAEQAVARLFCHNDPHQPLIRELMRICLERKLADAR